jgi:hypothetical protein
MSASTIIDWSALGQVVLYSVVAGVGVPAIFALAVYGAARSTEPHRSGTAASAYALLSLLGGLACLGAIAYGIYLMTQK